MNKVMIMGRLGQDPKLEYTPASLAVCSLSVATSEKYKSGNDVKERTEWHRVIVFGKLAEICSQYLKKGSQIFVEGFLKTRSWDENNFKKYITEIMAREVKFLDGFPKDEKKSEMPSEPEVYTTDNVVWADDEIKF